MAFAQKSSDQKSTEARGRAGRSAPEGNGKKLSTAAARTFQTMAFLWPSWNATFTVVELGEREMCKRGSLLAPRNENGRSVRAMTSDADGREVFGDVCG